MKNFTEFPLLKPEDMPEHAKEVVKKLEYYKTAYKNGQDMSIPIDGYYIKHPEFDCNFWEDDLDIKPPKTVQLIEFMNETCFNGVYKYGPNNEYLLSYELEEPIVDVVKNTENVIQFNSWLSKKGIPFLYVQLPNKISPIEKNLPKGTSNYQNFVATEFVSKLKYAGINTLDYRQTMLDEDINFEENFFKSDTHWKPSLAFHSTKKICESIGEIVDFKFDMDKFNLSNWNKLCYKNLMLGSRGRCTGLLYAGLDDFDLLLPKFDTDFTWSCSEKGFYVRGTFDKTLLFTPHMDWHYFNINPYAIYSIMVGGHTHILNHMNTKGRKILFLCDSFTRPISGFISPHFSELHFVDIRGDLDKYYVFELINKINPDIVVMSYFSSAIAKNSKCTDVNPYT